MFAYQTKLMVKKEENYFKKIQSIKMLLTREGIVILIYSLHHEVQFLIVMVMMVMMMAMLFPHIFRQKCKSSRKTAA